MEVTRDFWQVHERQVTLVYTVLFLVFQRYEGAKYFTGRNDQRNLTLKVNETLELYFSVAETLEDNRNIAVFVQHRSLVGNNFNTECILRVSRHNCSTSSGWCRCLRWNIGNYSFQKVVEKKDSGSWLLQFLDKGTEFTETLYIIAQGVTLMNTSCKIIVLYLGPCSSLIVEDNDDREETNNSTITTITSITTTNIIIIACSGTAVIISIINVVVCCCRWRSRKAARAAGTGPEGNIGVATRSRGGRCIQQGDNTAYMSPASVMTLREYAGIMTPQQLQQQNDFCSESPSNENIYGNISYPVKQNRWKIGQRCSRLVRRFLPLTTFSDSEVKGYCEGCPQASTDDDVGIYSNLQEDTIYENFSHVTQSRDLK